MVCCHVAGIGSGRAVYVEGRSTNILGGPLIGWMLLEAGESFLEDGCGVSLLFLNACLDCCVIVEAACGRSVQGVGLKVLSEWGQVL
jgi:hypothetical protein